MAISIDPIASPRIITVLAPDTSISAQDLVNQVRDWEDDQLALEYPHLINASGKESLGGGVYVGITVTLQNALLAFEARPGPSFVQCTVSGGNLVAVDENNVPFASPIQTTAYTQVIVTSSSSATLQELATIQYASFNGGVSIDAIGGAAGTAYPLGTPSNPVNNLADALTIASERGFYELHLMSNLTLDTGDTVDGMTFHGHLNNILLTLNPGAVVTNCVFKNLEIQGTLDGGSEIDNCVVKTLNYVDGHIHNSILTGTITLGGVNDVLIMDCKSGIPGATTPIIDMGGTAPPLAIRNYNGGIKLINKSNTAGCSIDLNSGQIIVDSTITNGTIIVRGVGKVTDNATLPATVDSTNLISGEKFNQIPVDVWNALSASFTTNGTAGKELVDAARIIKIILALTS